MSKRRLVIAAVLSGQSQSQVARTYGVSQGWISKVVARHRLEGEAAFEPLSRARKTYENATAPETVELVVTPDPAKRPKNSYLRFEAEQPNETWQSDFTHYRLTDGTRHLTHRGGIRRLEHGTDVEILTWLHDCSRYACQ